MNEHYQKTKAQRDKDKRNEETADIAAIIVAALLFIAFITSF